MIDFAQQVTRKEEVLLMAITKQFIEWKLEYKRQEWKKKRDNTNQLEKIIKN